MYFRSAWGENEKRVRPMAVADVTRIIRAVLVGGRLSGRTVSATGPEELTLREAVQRVARVVRKRPRFFRLPVALHYALAWFWERTMNVPLISLAQVRILSEGLVDPLPACDTLPKDMQPALRFTEQRILDGLPEPRPFGIRDCRCLATVSG